MKLVTTLCWLITNVGRVRVREVRSSEFSVRQWNITGRHQTKLNQLSNTIIPWLNLRKIGRDIFNLGLIRRWGPLGCKNCLVQS